MQRYKIKSKRNKKNKRKGYK
ncbi:uncharacterized protein FRV6_16837 [Fusarium oxysporum]|uniref:Uncharacterized protein n=1 Tax=Fusarium oxysporum TaxID=5507 RepID=A0A2H3UFX5_FUSOX|nr:uncharacterized protein FRV6_16837 [Fusarium oxysporum]